MSKRYFNIVEILNWSHEKTKVNRVCYKEDCKEWGVLGVRENSLYFFCCNKHFKEEKEANSRRT
tara:strand:- start:336 stop:527 length:192 start_codon:yes stop_codon:yes gene_type:complete